MGQTVGLTGKKQCQEIGFGKSSAKKLCLAKAVPKDWVLKKSNEKIIFNIPLDSRFHNKWTNKWTNKIEQQMDQQNGTNQ